MPHTALDPGLAALITPHTGEIREAVPAGRGFMSEYTGTVDGGSGRVFVKAVRDPGRNSSSLEREAAIAPAVSAAGLSPALRWQARGGGWFALGFEVAGFDHHASFRPGSPDLPAVLDTVGAIGRTPLPDAAGDWAEHRYDRYADEGTAHLFEGGTLLHTDINPDNLLVRADGEITVVDWAWPSRGAAWMDLATLVVQLVAAGHAPGEAEGWASRCPAWRRAGIAGVDAFAGAVVRMYERFEERAPAPWRKAMTGAARAWAAHRRETA